MKNNKTVYKYFSIPKYRKEEEYLSSMHEQGWRLTKVSFPGFYHFEKCEPENVSYRLDYNQEGIRNKDEYVKMFADCGWEYLFDFVGYSYFRKAGMDGEEKEEIFCDDESRLEMMRRVFKGRILPLISLFVLVIIPQLLLNTSRSATGSPFYGVFSIFFLCAALIYLILFMVTAVQFYSYEKMVKGDSASSGLKLAAVITLLLLMSAGVVTFYVLNTRSVYEVKDSSSGYVLTAERLNTSVAREYELKKGDKVDFIISYSGGYVRLSLAEEGKEPVFFGDSFQSGSYTVEIMNDGRYKAEVSGSGLCGSVECVIK